MTPGLTISDHALLRYMERFYGVDVEAWRTAMLSDVEAAIRAYPGNHTPGQQAFIISSVGRVVTVLDEKCPYAVTPRRPAVAIPRITLGNAP